jgi:hypothetical protein
MTVGTWRMRLAVEQQRQQELSTGMMLTMLGRNSHLVVSTFRTMAVAEEELANAKAAKPACATVIDRVFGIGYRTDPLIRKGESVYRIHFKELIERVLKNEDTRPATKAEVLCALLDTSLAAPLRRDPQALAEALWRELFPRQPMSKRRDQTRPTYKGSVVELFEQMQRKLAVAARVIDENR